MIAAYRSGITIADPSAVAVPLIPCLGMAAINIGATCTVVGGEIWLRVIQLNVDGNVIGESSQIVLMTHTTVDWPSSPGAPLVPRCVGIPPPNAFPIPLAANSVLIVIDQVTGGGAWTFFTALISATVPTSPGTPQPV